MKTKLIETVENRQRVYDSLVLDAKHLGIFSNELAVKIIGELAKQPLCAMDISRKLKQHEQKIYYHLKKMRNAGIVKLNGTEERYGMTARIFELVSPVIATKLYDEGYEIKQDSAVNEPEVQEFLSPFVKDGSLNATIIIGDPYSHGRFDEGSTEGPFAFDFGILLGKFAKNIVFPGYKLDTEIDSKDLKENLILIGNSKTNVIIDKINSQLPVYFDEKKDYRLISRTTGNVYKDPRVGLIAKITNPFSKNKKIMVIGGVGSRGTRAAVLSCTQYLSSVVSEPDRENDSVRVVKGFDKSGNKVIDSIEVLE